MQRWKEISPYLEPLAPSPCSNGAGAELQSKKERSSPGEVPAPSWASPLQRKAGLATVFTAPSCFMFLWRHQLNHSHRKSEGGGPSLLPARFSPGSLPHSTQELEAARVETCPPCCGQLPRCCAHPGDQLPARAQPTRHLAEAPRVGPEDPGRCQDASRVCGLMAGAPSNVAGPRARNEDRCRSLFK